jgi:hypothetical protein
MKIHLFLIYSVLGSTLIHAQVQRQMQSTQGGMYTTSQGVVVSQTVGQQSVIGRNNGATVSLSQGFQQKNWALLIDSNNDTFQPLIYPNPFRDGITFSFGTEINRPVTIALYNVAGIKAFSTTFTPEGTTAYLAISKIPSATYMAKVTYDAYTYYQYLIKY